MTAPFNIPAFDVNAATDDLRRKMHQRADLLEATPGELAQHLAHVTRELIEPNVGLQRLAVDLVAQGYLPDAIVEGFASVISELVLSVVVTTRKPALFTKTAIGLQWAAQVIVENIADGTLVAAPGSDPLAELKAARKRGLS